MSSEGGPVFVDVDDNQQLPTFSQLLTAGEVVDLAHADETKKIEPLQPIVFAASTSVASSDTSKEPQIHDSQDKEQKEAELACTKIQERPFQCQECKRFSCDTEEKLIRHMRMHRGENPFQCFMCEYSTYNKAVFEEHVRVHQGIKPFKCSHCDYKSASKKNAKKHEQIHREDNPNKCQDCDFIGRNPQAYKRHRLTEHSDKRTCKYCKTSFPTKTKLDGHYKNMKTCPKKNCDFKFCNSKVYYEHMKEVHNEEARMFTRLQKKSSKLRKDLFQCKLCTWSSSSKPRILLHLIHHPKQKVDESVIDLTILRNCGIVK